jgi:hypothetical protein
VSTGIRSAPRSIRGETDIERFTGWIKDPSSSTASRAALCAEIAGYGHASLPEMMQMVREEMLACLTGLEDCNSRRRDQRRQAEISIRDSSSIYGAVRTTLWREAASWGRRLDWLEEVRRCLEDR